MLITVAAASSQCLAQGTLPGQPSEGPLESGQSLAFLSLAVVLLLHTYSTIVFLENYMVPRNKAISLREPAGSRAIALFERCGFRHTTRLNPMDTVPR